MTEIEACLVEEIEVREQLARIVDAGLITSTMITGEISIAAFASGVGLSVAISLSGTSLLLSLATVIKTEISHLLNFTKYCKR